MAFEWARIHKHEEQIEMDVAERVSDYVLEFYDVECIEDLTEQQIQEILAYRDTLNEFSVMQWGFSDLINRWDSQEFEEIHE